MHVTRRGTIGLFRHWAEGDFAEVERLPSFHIRANVELLMLELVFLSFGFGRFGRHLWLPESLVVLTFQRGGPDFKTTGRLK